MILPASPTIPTEPGVSVNGPGYYPRGRAPMCRSLVGWFASGLCVSLAGLRLQHKQVVLCVAWQAKPLRL